MYEAIIGVAGTLLGTMLGFLLSAKISHEITRRQINYDLMKYLSSTEHYFILHAVWEISEDWWKGDKEALLWHFLLPPTPRKLDPEKRLENGLYRHGNLDVFLRVLTQLIHYYNKRIIDREIFIDVFRHHYAWYKGFLEDFIHEYSLLKKQSGDILPDPSWITIVHDLDKILEQKPFSRFEFRRMRKNLLPVASSPPSSSQDKG